MVGYLIDSNICIYLLNGRNDSLRRKFEAQKLEKVHLCSVVKAELLAGARKSAQSAANVARFEAFFLSFPSLPFDDAAAIHYSYLRAGLELAGTPIGPNDMLIAAIARAHGLTLVTNNLREFSRVPGLLVEDWTA